MCFILKGKEKGPHLKYLLRKQNKTIFCSCMLGMFSGWKQVWGIFGEKGMGKQYTYRVGEPLK